MNGIIQDTETRIRRNIMSFVLNQGNVVERGLWLMGKEWRVCVGTEVGIYFEG